MILPDIITELVGARLDRAASTLHTLACIRPALAAEHHASLRGAEALRKLAHVTARGQWDPCAAILRDAELDWLEQAPHGDRFDGIDRPCARTHDPDWLSLTSQTIAPVITLGDLAVECPGAVERHELDRAIELVLWAITRHGDRRQSRTLAISKYLKAKGCDTEYIEPLHTLRVADENFARLQRYAMGHYLLNQ